MTHVLIVDDEPDILAAVQMYLEAMAMDIEVTTAVGADRALELLDHGRFDVVISDFRMPGMDGFGLCREVERRHHLPCILMTAYGDAEVQGRARAERIAKVFGKPPDMDALADAIITLGNT